MARRGPEKLEKVAVSVTQQLQRNVVSVTLGNALAAWKAAPSADWIGTVQYLIAEDVELRSVPRVAAIPSADAAFAMIESDDARSQLGAFVRGGRRAPMRIRAKRVEPDAPPQAVPDAWDIDERSWVSESAIE
jgi:hypothetical protein